MRWWRSWRRSPDDPHGRALLPGLSTQAQPPFPSDRLQRYLQAGMLPQAAELFREHGRSREAVELYLERGEPAAALAEVQRSGAEDRRERLAWARAFMSKGWLAEAEALVRPLVSGGPGNWQVEARVLLAEALLALGQEAEARRQAELALAEDVHVSAAWTLIGSLRGTAEQTAVDVGMAGGRFGIRRLLGRGGTGKVFLAVDQDRGGVVALKLFDQYPAVQSLSSLFHGLRLVASLPPHPRVLPVLDLEPALRLVVTPYLPGGSLQGLATLRPPSPRWARLLLGTALGLGHLHRFGVLHLDLKPANVLLTADGASVVSDFSLCRSAPPWPKMGSVEYASPEALLGESLEEASDVYSLGVVAYELATGARPFPAGTPIRTARFRPLAERRPDFPASAGLLVEQMLQLDPAERIPLPELIEALRRL
jgi:serine/threonine-protein kinase